MHENGMNICVMRHYYGNTLILVGSAFFVIYQLLRLAFYSVFFMTGQRMLFFNSTYTPSIYCPSCN